MPSTGVQNLLGSVWIWETDIEDLKPNKFPNGKTEKRLFESKKKNLVYPKEITDTKLSKSLFSPRMHLDKINPEVCLLFVKMRFATSFICFFEANFSVEYGFCEDTLSHLRFLDYQSHENRPWLRDRDRSGNDFHWVPGFRSRSLGMLPERLQNKSKPARSEEIRQVKTEHSKYETPSE